ncbi:hypothetical protein ACMD2_18778 [Ananas comosus]|uniref:Uncharacterized protein n=1 Tax=Ananas comosus TaxID=4615 RepID=A0A199VVD4_ANACO|nr:hypothetical protein ACMD2_18778 [Ananas comosus]
MVLTFLGSEENMSIGDERDLWRGKSCTPSKYQYTHLPWKKREKLYSFKVPVHAPTMEEVKEVIQKGGLFDVSRA